MRLTQAQINTIKSTATAVLGEGTQVWLFGSRLDGERRGGDVDLLVESDRKPSVMDHARFKYHVENALQLPVDVLMVQIGQKASPFDTIARAKGVSLTMHQGAEA